MRNMTVEALRETAQEFKRRLPDLEQAEKNMERDLAGTREAIVQVKASIADIEADLADFEVASDTGQFFVAKDPR